MLSILVDYGRLTCPMLLFSLRLGLIRLSLGASIFAALPSESRAFSLLIGQATMMRHPHLGIGVTPLRHGS